MYFKTEFARIGSEKKLRGAVSCTFRNLKYYDRAEKLKDWYINVLSGRPGMQSVVYTNPAHRAGKRIYSAAYVKT